MDALSKEIQALLDPTMRATVTARVTSGSTTYFLVTQTDDEAGGQVLIEQADGATPRIVGSDSSLYPFGSLPIPDDVASKLNHVVAPTGGFFDAPLSVFPGVTPPTTNEELNRRVLAKAKECVGTLDSSNVPATNGGRLACAWAVNEVVRRALGKPIGGRLSTANMYKVLKEHHTLVSGSNIKAGHVIISPTAGGVTGHVGIVSDIANPMSDTVILSNSSDRAVFDNHRDFASWKRRYVDDKGLKMVVYALEKDRFQAGTT